MHCIGIYNVDMHKAPMQWLFCEANDVCKQYFAHKHVPKGFYWCKKSKLLEKSGGGWDVVVDHEMVL